MELIILDRHPNSALIRRRRRLGLGRFDEVWEGVYIMSPLANNEHQEICTDLVIALGMAIMPAGLGMVLAGGNVSDRDNEWKRNYRCPDIVVFMDGNRAQNKKTHWLGGPDFVVEVVSRYDRSREKFDFYAKVGTQALLIVDRYPWALDLYRLNSEGHYDPIGRSMVEQPELLASRVMPLSFRPEARH